jgi:hypothetical protein
LDAETIFFVLAIEFQGRGSAHNHVRLWVTENQRRDCRHAISHQSDDNAAELRYVTQYVAITRQTTVHENYDWISALRRLWLGNATNSDIERLIERRVEHREMDEVD